jgi:hypothetical protein
VQKGLIKDTFSYEGLGDIVQLDASDKNTREKHMNNFAE